MKANQSTVPSRPSSSPNRPEEDLEQEDRDDGEDREAKQVPEHGSFPRGAGQRVSTPGRFKKFHRKYK